VLQYVLDPVLKAVLNVIGDAPYADLEAMPLDSAMLIARPQIAPTAPPADSEDWTIGGYQGEQIRVRLYFPEIRSTTLPVLLHLHGGGFVAGSIEQDDVRCGWLARAVECAVVSVGYRLAPEHAFPIAIEDAFAAWAWITTRAAVFGVDTERCAIGGSSAGGHISIGVTLLARARGARMPLFQLLTYPVIAPEMDTQSYRDFADGPFMTRARMAWYWKQYSSGAAGQGNELWAPMAAAAAGLPPTHVITAEYDVLRDEGEAYAAHLRAAQIETTVERHARMVHGFITLVPNHDASRTALCNSAAALRRAFSRSAPSRDRGISQT
jgi:acetyl esterase